MIRRRKPLLRKTPLRRRTPLKRGGPILRLSPIRSVSRARARDRSMYRRDVGEYLRDHPFCQIFLARNRISEANLALNSWADLAGRRYVLVGGRTTEIPRAAQIHHRNKRHGERLLDKRFWMAASAREHEWVEAHKAEARELGLLLPIQADAQGRWGDGNQALTTSELIEARARGET
jgi:hypothetical protein